MRQNNERKKRAQGKPTQRRQQAGQGEAPEVEPTLAERLSLQVLVITAGAVLMSLEIAGSRVLAPYFGNSVFVWGSLISVFLMALSLGYYLGGRVADRFPSRLLLNSICAVVALLMFGIALFSHDVSTWVETQGFGEQSGPFVASLILFLPPSVGMGFVSPFAVRLATCSVHTVGRSAGTLYSLSTMGSIAGTLLTTFVLIPTFGLTFILKGLAVTMLVVAVGTMPVWKTIFQRPKVLMGLFVLCLVSIVCVRQPAPSRIELVPGDKILLDVTTPYHHITVIDRNDVRLMHFDRYVETAIQTTEPYRSLAGYTDYFHLAFLAQPDIKRSLFIGAGGGVGPRTFHRHAPEMEIDVVDIDPKVLEIAQSHFFLNPDQSPRIRAIAEDGRMFVRKAPKRQYDCLVLDAFTIGGRIPPHLVTREFLALCRDRITEDGVFVMNINSAIEGSKADIFRSMYRTLDTVFPNTYVFAMRRRGGRSVSTNVILVATNQTQRLSLQDWTARAETYQSTSYVDNLRLRQMIAHLLVDVPDTSQAPLFTDDYAPIETMTF